MPTSYIAFLVSAIVAFLISSTCTKPKIDHQSSDNRTELKEVVSIKNSSSHSKTKDESNRTSPLSIPVSDKLTLVEVTKDAAIFINSDKPEQYLRANPRIILILKQPNLTQDSHQFSRLSSINRSNNSNLPELFKITTSPEEYVQDILDLNKNNVYYEPDWEIQLIDNEILPQHKVGIHSPKYLDYTGPMIYSQWHFDVTNMYTYSSTLDATSQPIIVGVVDTGVDYTHPQLANNVFTNPNEIPNNGIDDDNNGYIDDIHGWNFINNTPNSLDDHVHGTHVAGTIAATYRKTSNSNISFPDAPESPASSLVKILPLKALDATGYGYSSAVVEALYYAAEIDNMYLLNHSWGGNAFTYSYSLLKAINALGDSYGILQVCAAGNETSDNGNSAHYPSGYNTEYVVSVAATDTEGSLAYFSNYGSTVDIAAPGAPILSTIPTYQTDAKQEYSLTDDVAFLQGTSMATPVVTCALALLKTPYKNVIYKDPTELVDVLLQNSQSTNVNVIDNKVLLLPSLNQVTTEIEIIYEPQTLYEDLGSYGTVKIIRKGDLNKISDLEMYFEGSADPFDSNDFFTAVSREVITFNSGEKEKIITLQAAPDITPSPEPNKTLYVYAYLLNQNDSTVYGNTELSLIDEGYPENTLPVPNPEGDDDNDGIKNLLEHAFAMDPNSNSYYKFEQELDSNSYTASFAFPSNVTALSFTIQTSPNLKDWVPAQNVQLSTEVLNDYMSVHNFTVQKNQSQNPSDPLDTQRFFRIKPSYN